MDARTLRFFNFRSERYTPPCRSTRGSTEVRILRKIDEGWTELIFIKNNGIPSTQIRLEVRICCPIRDDQFAEEMKTEEKHPWRGIVPKVSKNEGSVGLRFEKNFGKIKRAATEELKRMYGESAPRRGEPVNRTLEIKIRQKSGNPSTHIHVKPGNSTMITAKANLGAHAELCIELEYSPIVDNYCLAAPVLTSIEPLPRENATISEDALHVDSSNSTLNLILGQAMTDLLALRLPIFVRNVSQNKNDTRYTALNAGVPRYIGLFGRDNLVTAWQSPLFGLEIFESVLSRLELLQGIRRDDRRDEEMNRFPHERRLDPLSEMGVVNRDLYYGDVTSTPFWILALSTLYQWSGDRELLFRHRLTVLRCCQWILRRLEEGKGFIYYAPAGSGRDDENRNQAWKDSGDAIVDADGRVCVPPLAVAEIQGYAYQALIEAAEIFKVLGGSEDNLKYLREAQALKLRFNREFWIEKEEYYALALDGDRLVLAAKASNVGHCLNTGILDLERVPSVIRAFMADDMFSGWGIRTLSSNNRGYDPFSYHRGAVWPVENAFIANGMARLGFQRESQRISTAQLTVAALFQHMRLPEVLSGHTRTSVTPTPGVYNFGNLLQAWSVSAIVQHLQTILGIRPRADQRTLYLDPHLPDWLEWIELKNIKVGSSSLHIRFWRNDDGKSCWKLLRKLPSSPQVHDEIHIKSGVPIAFGQDSAGLRLAS